MRKNSISSFIQKTWDILQNPQNSHILAWSKEGTSFIIKDDQLLSSQLLPKYFKHSNFSSFIRQLNMYNFHKIKKTQNSMEFYHRLFRKDKRELLIGIKRKPSEAQIQYGEELIRKMNRQGSKSISRQNSISDENSPTSSEEQQIERKKEQMNEDFEKRRVFDSPPTFYLPMSMWMGYGMPLYEINQEHYENGSDDLYRHKILTNIIIKTPPDEWNK